MSSPEPPDAAGPASPADPRTARFRRGAGRPVGPPGPPPPVHGMGIGRGSVDPAAGGDVAPWPLTGDSGRPLSLDDLPLPGGLSHPAPPPAPPAYGELAENRWPGAPRAQPDDEAGDDAGDWPDVDDDPGRRSGVVAIVVGFFVGVVGVFIGIASIRASRRVGLAGALGTAGIVVSVLNIVVGGVVGISWVRYEVSLQQQCSFVGPGQYVTQNGDRVTCH
ncbi:hypothetical protein [Frondihabitans australicus]|uniref:DUF4190 domain-containing protein n=1 Tax=Frondihabitans australicus TaxID=386892 RepID=A0A495II58_9MICO|nr:hypothetical protein [Frondihabitans australicus]RKR75722.1 hypothetical protein C8E83_2875 [Frondihabitans australicus]